MHAWMYIHSQHHLLQVDLLQSWQFAQGRLRKDVCARKSVSPPACLPATVPLQSCIEAEQERHASTSAQVEVTGLRQQLRTAATAATAPPASAGLPHSGSATAAASGGLKRPLHLHHSASLPDAAALPRASASAMALEDLMEEACADLEQMEAHVASATQRLVGLQAQNLALAQDAAAATKAKLAAEGQARQEQEALKVGRRDGARRYTAGL